MRKRLVAIGAALAALAALVFAAAAYAAYTSAKLSVTYPGGATRIVASSAVGDDATARAAIVIPNGTGITTTAAPGTKVGTAKAQVSALALGGALLPLEGDIVVAPPGAVPAATQAQCIQTATPSATYLLVLQAAGQTINLPAYLIPTSGPQTALGPAQLVFCLSPPDIPTDQGGATFGAKFLSADLTFNGVFTPLTAALWIGFWTPWQAGTGQVNTAGTVASVDAILPAGVTLKGKRVNGRVTLTGKVTLAGEGIDNAVQIWGAVGKTGLKRLKSVLAKENGTFTVTFAKTAKQKNFQARTSSSELSVQGDIAKLACDAAFPNNGLGVPCSSFTLAPFAAKSKIVTVR